MNTQGEWECRSCGYVHDGESAPGSCPDCGAPASRFVFFAFIDDSNWDEELAVSDVVPFEDYDLSYPE